MARPAFLALLTLLAATSLTLAFPTQPMPARITMNGEEAGIYHLPVIGDEPEPQVGDLLWIDRHLVVKGPEKSSSYFQLGRDEQLWLELPGGRRQLVFVRVEWRHTDEQDATGRYKRVLVNPLKGLSVEELRGLRGVEIAAWSDDLLPFLERLDLAHVCLSFKINGLNESKFVFPRLPDGVRYLDLEEFNAHEMTKDHTELRKLGELRYLSVSTLSFDCNLLQAQRRLLRLKLSALELKDPAALQGLTELRRLDLEYNDDLKTVAFAAKLPHLLALNVTRTAVADLSPLNGHPSLREIDATAAPVTTLPLAAPLPNLRQLGLFSTKVRDVAAAAFAKLHPHCSINLRWKGALARALVNANRLRVRSGGTCHRDVPKERTLFEEKDPAKVAALVGLIDLDEAQCNFHCMCCGNPSIEFYDNDRPVLTLGYHHGKSLRWPEGWPMDAMLTPDEQRT